MSPSARLSSSFVLLAVASVVRADYFSKDPLANKVVPFDQIPYQVMTDTDDPRGFQSGYNRCNSTTENQDSLCQTMFVNHIDDWCVWAPAKPNSTIADEEGDVVAWCTKKGHGTRIIPAGAITGLQLIQTPSYIQIAGTIKQEYLNIAGQYGGELDSGGQDGEGNPMGGLVYTNAFGGNTDLTKYTQAQHWSFFVGGNFFCGKICDQTKSNPQGLCNNIYDRIGCEYNAPNSAKEGTFEACKGDDMLPVGVYVGADSKTSTYHQPPSETDPIDNIPYTPTPAATSECTPFQSAAIFTDGANVTPAAGNGVGANPTGGASGSAPSGSAGPSGSKASGAGNSPSKSSGSTVPSQSGQSGALSLTRGVAGVEAGVLGVMAGVVAGFVGVLAVL
ncbi:hypothetical protein R3P38DRAFT_3396844 [Favolaschia claudopus]|uniref:Macrofage activating glycoprotein n=1 Tax=Favolaschia claudopus TaxID=2862362 RepID=A0AAW0BCI1_9AGAR